jgi:flagellar biosynthesis protein FlhG
LIDQASRLRELMGKSAVVVDRDARPQNAATRVIAVTSGKGGVGKTTVAVNLALLLAERGHRVLVADADLGLANVDVMLGLNPARHLGRLLISECAAEEIAEEGPLGVMVISGGSGLRELAEADEYGRELLRDKLRAYYPRFDFVVIDTSPGIGDHVLGFLRDADEILLVTTPEPTSLRDTYAATKAIVSRVPGIEPSLVVNMAPSESAAADAVNALNTVTDKFLGRKYEDWFRIESDPIIGRAINDRQPAALSYPRSPSVVSLRRVARTLMETCARISTPIQTGGGQHALTSAKA